MNLPQSKKIWLGGGVLVAILVVLLGWFGGISPKLSEASSLRSQTTDAQDQNTLLQIKINKLKKQNANLTELTSQLNDALAALPFDSGLPDFTRQLSKQAAAHRVQITSIAIGGITPAAGAGGSSSIGTSGGILAIPVTVLSRGTAKDQIAFLHAIQVDGPRRALVNATQLAPGSGAAEASIDSTSLLTAQLTIFSAPQPAAAQAQLRKLLNGDVAN